MKCEKCDYYLESKKYCKWLYTIAPKVEECIHFKEKKEIKEVKNEKNTK